MGVKGAAIVFTVGQMAMARYIFRFKPKWDETSINEVQVVVNTEELQWPTAYNIAINVVVRAAQYLLIRNYHNLELTRYWKEQA